MTIVVDASTVVAALFDSGPDGEWAERQLVSEPLAAPDLLLAEVANVLRKSEQAKLVSAESAAMAFATLGELTVQLSPFAPLAERVWELRGNLTAYDAFYVALAEILDSPLATLDKRLAAAPGPTCEFLTPGPD